MPRLVKDFPATEPGSLVTYAVDFAPYIPPAASLVSATWALTLHAVQPGGIPDPAPGSHLSGAAWIAPNTQTPPANTVAAQRIGGLIAGNDYLVTVTGATSDGETVILWAVLPCRAPQ